MNKLLPLVIACIAALALAPGCDEVNRSAFGGVIGVVGHPAIGNCQVEIYNGLEFESLESTKGLIRTGRTEASGRFSIALPDSALGRPLVLVARPGPGAVYRDFGATGAPDIPFEVPNQPWVSVLSEWLGAESYAPINPITTVAFHALMRLPGAEHGPGRQRFNRLTMREVQHAVAANFGLAVSPSLAGVTPPQGSEFSPLSVFYLEDSNASQSYAYACLQLAVAANNFVNATPSLTDTALDFYDALFIDAQDQVLDGAYFGAPVPLINEVPAHVGRDVDGTSNLLKFLASNPLSPVQEGFTGAGRGSPGFAPTPADMLAAQDRATGTLRPLRVDSHDVSNYPYSSDLVLTVRGAGFRGTDAFVCRSADDANATFTVDFESVGVDGEILFRSDTEWRVRLPDFAVTTLPVPLALRVASGANFRIVHFVAQHRPEVRSSANNINFNITTTARVTDRTEPLLIGVQLGRVNAAGGLDVSSYGNNIEAAATDPDSLNPATDNVYELRARVANPGPDTVNGLGLDVLLSAFSQQGQAVTAELFTGAPAAGTSLIFSATPTVNLAPGDEADFVYRLVFLDSAIGVDIVEGAPVQITPVFSGIGAGSGNALSTSDVIGFNRTVALGPAGVDATAVLDTFNAPTLPAAVTAGDSFDVRIELAAAPLAGGAMRTLQVTDLDVTVTFDGETSVLRLTDEFFATAGLSDLYFTALVLESTGGRAWPFSLTQLADTDAVILTIRTDPGRTGALTIDVTARARDVATGTPSEQTAPTANTTIS